MYIFIEVPAGVKLLKLSSINIPERSASNVVFEFETPKKT